MIVGQLQRFDSFKLTRLLPLEPRPRLRLARWRAHAASSPSLPTVTPPEPQAESASASLSPGRNRQLYWQWVSVHAPPFPPSYWQGHCQYMLVYVCICMYM